MIVKMKFRIQEGADFGENIGESAILWMAVDEAVGELLDVVPIKAREVAPEGEMVLEYRFRVAAQGRETILFATLFDDYLSLDFLE
jgi:hypothetical protein